jgi:hypothetical protein
MAFNYFTALLAGYFFVRHDAHCEDYMYVD